MMYSCGHDKDGKRSEEYEKLLPHERMPMSSGQCAVCVDHAKQLPMQALSEAMERVNVPFGGMRSFHGRGILEPAKPALYSTHAIARHLLSHEDRVFEYDDPDGYTLHEEELGMPLRERVPAVLTEEERKRREILFGNLKSGTISLTTYRTPLKVRDGY